MTGRLTAALMGLAALTMATPTRAQTPAGPHFTFTVPVRITNLPPEIQRYSVQCAVFPTGGTLMATGQAPAPSAEAPPLRGGLVADVVVQVTVTNPLLDPALATEYSCSLFLYGVAPGSPLTAASSTVYMDNANTRFPLAAGALIKKSATGPIPR
ncbi:MAG: hypothetical protein NTW72_11395 [Gemmatimonadetes bacterium]|nr:hypothetical protein [Gemmatimonadota bacterium]